MKKLYFLALFLFTITAFSQNYSYTAYNPSNSGIASSGISDIKVDSGGVLWLATYGALTSFNGTTFTNYTSANSGIQAIDLKKIAIDSQNRKWIATGENGVIMYNGTTWTNYRTTNSGLPDNVINDIAVDASNNVWIATYSGLVKFNGTTWTTYNTSNSNITGNAITSVAVNSANKVYLTNSGILLEFTGATFTILGDQANKIRRIVGNDMYVDKQPGIGGYLKYTNGIVSAGVQYDGSCMLDCQVEGMDVDQNGKVWINYSRECANGGLQNFSDCQAYYPANPLANLEFTSCLEVINSNTIWIGTYQYGLIKMALTAAPCSAPSNLTVDVTSATSATFSWTAASPAPSGYAIMISNSSTLSGSPVYTTSNSITFTVLSPNSDYYWWVASTCGNGQSEWVPGGFFYTPVPPPCFAKMSNGDNHTIAIKGDGSLWGWGENGYYQLGLGVTTDKNVPTRIGNATDWVAVAASTTHSMALKSDGSLWAWGYNGSGELGDGTTVDKMVPTRIGTANTWAKIAINQGKSMAIKTDGTLWAWGSNGAGDLGFGDTTNRTVPTRLGTGFYKEVSTGSGHTLAISTSDKLWAWGWNNNGSVGNNSATTVVTTPVQIGTASWQYVEANQSVSYGIKTDGTLWGWGWNPDNRLGLGFSGNIITPTQIGTATNWSKVQIGYGQNVAIRTDGSLWGWGFNTEGELGLGNTVFRSFPTRIGFANDWLAAGAGDRYGIYLKTNGDMFTAGWSPQGQMGLGANAVHTTMVEIGCPTTVLSNEDFEVANEMKLYPNPVKDSFKVENIGNVSAMVIYDMKGAVVKTITADFNSAIDVSGFQKGIYLLKVTNDNGSVFSTRLIKE
jgi:alpha-tubulin suppressor-like RCC1 family protein